MKRWLIALLAMPVIASANERVVAIGGDVTEIAFALGSGDQLVARDSTSLHPQAATKLPDVGYMRQLNAEGILAMRPTLVLASAQAKPSLALEQVASSHVKVVTIPAGNSLDAIDEKIDAVAQAMGKTAQGDALRKQVHSKLALIPEKPLPVKVLFIMSHGGMTAMAAGQETAADAAIHAAGLQNAMQGFKRYQPMSQEGVIASQPQLILVTADGVKTLGGEDNVWKLPGIVQTPAGKSRQLLVVDDMALLGFGLQTPDAILALRKKAEQLP
ncbi:iron complex transport system substrate-binding protein [Buttiauxella sp. BIGb0552]|uniref:heme/hemin ABC transporter substrate-binding protein n=1 Tax=Buttiauxella sp. BIGb0552 TaxID=2485120 RepID=UPI0010669B82|nr:hemin ABC transporter substrate-binding protein [Buttiauxella sp. BIGb0552]TDX20655.1 iron complex transport system substrate-binding protein [Buttiauxella sp. BIGb0552]